MKKITLEKVLWSLENETEEVVLDQEIIKKAQKCLTNMLTV